MRDDTVIIIGAGISGLSTGCYTQMNGYRTRIYEMHSQPGGLCTSWQRKGYTIDGCLHWLVGSAPGSSLHSIWQELGAVQGREFAYPDEFLRYEDADGRCLTFFADLDKTVQQMLALAPEDEALIREFQQIGEASRGMEMPLNAPEVSSILDSLRSLRQLPTLLKVGKWARVSMREVTERFQNPLLRAAMASTWFPEFPALFLAMTLAWVSSGNAGYPIGGSAAFARAIERRYLGLGGTVHYNQRVERILVDNGRAVGVRLADGTVERAGTVVSTIDGHATLDRLLEGRFYTDKLRRWYATATPFPSCALVALGVARTFPDESTATSGFSFPVEPFEMPGQTVDRLGAHIFNYDPTLAPEGKTLINVVLPGDYDAWASVAQDREAYRDAKARLAEDCISRLEHRIPGISAQVEMVDVATPLTFERYTGNYRGSIQGWLATPQTFTTRLPRQLAGLEGFYMAGQWTEAMGGVPPAGMAGRHIAQIMCQRDGKRFQTSIPGEA